MANISSLLEIIRTAHLGRDMRAALHDSIDAVNDDVESCGQTLGTSSNKLQLKRGSTVLSEVTIPSGGSTVSWNQIRQSGEKIAQITINDTTIDVYASAGGGGGSGSVDTVNGVSPDENGNVQLSPEDIGTVGSDIIGHFYDDLQTESGTDLQAEDGNAIQTELDIYAYVDSKTPKKLSDLQSDSTHRTVTDSEKSSWNNKASASDLPTTITGSFERNTSVVSDSGLIVKQYGNVVNINGVLSLTSSGNTNETLGVISGVSVPSVIGDMLYGIALVGFTTPQRIIFNVANGSLSIWISNAVSNEIVYIDMTYIV